MGISPSAGVDIASRPFDSPARPRYAEIKWFVTAPESGCAIRFIPLPHPAFCVQNTPAQVRPYLAATFVPVNRIPVIRIKE